MNKAYEIAKKELGVYELVGPMHNKRILEYHKTTGLAATDDETPWCSAFVNYCVTQAGLKGTNSAAARSWLSWGQKTEFPVEGDIVVIKRGTSETSGHVGFFVGLDDNHVWIYGGNQGNKVCLAHFPKEAILGYRAFADKVQTNGSPLPTSSASQPNKA